MDEVEYAVGRIYFQKPEEYANYAQSVVKAEQKQRTKARKAAFFGTRNQGDIPTKISAQYLIEPLAESMAERYTERNYIVLGDPPSVLAHEE